MSAPFGNRTRGLAELSASQPVSRRIAPSNPWHALPTDAWMGKPLSIDTPDDFDRDIMDAAEQAHPAPSYLGSIAIGLFAAAAGGLAIALVVTTVRLWL